MIRYIPKHLVPTNPQRRRYSETSLKKYEEKNPTVKIVEIIGTRARESEYVCSMSNGDILVLHPKQAAAMSTDETFYTVEAFGVRVLDAYQVKVAVKWQGFKEPSFANVTDDFKRPQDKGNPVEFRMQNRYLGAKQS